MECRQGEGGGGRCVHWQRGRDGTGEMINEGERAGEGRKEGAYCFDRGNEPWGVSLEIECQLVEEGVCDVLGLEPGKCFKVGLK